MSDFLNNEIFIIVSSKPKIPESFPYGEVGILIDPGVGRLDRKVAGITFETWSQNDD